jgi:hypothetical protein
MHAYCVTFLCSGWLDLGATDRALALFRRGYANAQKPFQVWTEGADGTGCTTFLTGAGGFLQSVINGYLGGRLGSASLLLRPVAPPGNATRLTIRGLHWRGRRLRLEATASGASVELLTGAPVLLRSSASAIKLVVGDPPRRLPAPVHVEVLEIAEHARVSE